MTSHMLLLRDMQLRGIKHQNILIMLVAVALLSGSVLAVNFATSDNDSAPANLPEPTPQPFQLQIVSPSNNYTYGNYNGPLNNTSDQADHQTTYSLILPLNITASQETSRIAYSLDGAINITFNENTTATLTLSYGVHNLIVYGANNQATFDESKITFTVGYGYPSSLKLTMAQIQETVRYFESRGLKVQVLDESKWQNVGFQLYAGSVDLISKETFADIAIANGIDTIREVQDSNYIGFNANYYGNSWLPTVYVYSASLA